MPAQRDPSGRRFVAVETEGISSWFVPTQLEELYGEAGRAAAEREESVWQAWLARLFPAPVQA